MAQSEKNNFNSISRKRFHEEARKTPRYYKYQTGMGTSFPENNSKKEDRQRILELDCSNYRGYLHIFSDNMPDLLYLLPYKKEPDCKLGRIQMDSSRSRSSMLPYVLLL